MSQNQRKTFLPDLVLTSGGWKSNYSIETGDAGTITRLADCGAVDQLIRLDGRAALPGLVNAHSHAFQRVIRGRTEYRSREAKDSFWTWREKMYRAANHLTPEDLYDASRMAFLEMALSGITTVAEFHYLHHAPGGTAYEDPGILAKEVVRAARDVGLRIVLLRVAYARAGYETAENPDQARFIEADPNVYLRNLNSLRDQLTGDELVSVGVAPHSVRAVPLNYLKEVIQFANHERLPVHMHVAEQPAEVSACIAEYGRSPVALLETEGLLSERFTAVHAIHITDKAARALAASHALVCACPTTERNLGDGVVPAELLFNSGVRVCLGTDSHTQIDLFEDARELEYHLRLQKMERVVLADDEQVSSLAARLFRSSTKAGAESLGIPGGVLEKDQPGDFFTVDLNDVSIAGSNTEDLLSTIVFSLTRTAIRDVFVNGRLIVEHGRHRDQTDIVTRFKALQERLAS